MSEDLRTRPARQRFEQMRDAGAEARRSGKKRADNPQRGSTRQSHDMRDEWDRGWDIEDQARRGFR